jgi:UDP-N-acetylmuramoyl-L-alanyl-D-glutamate--2,6-diaminopimelate ligase
VFTNLTQDHLDFHPTMEDYFAAKRMLFEGPEPSIVNVDDPYGARLAAEVDAPITFAIDSQADYRARDVRFDRAGCSFTCETPDGAVAVETALPGLFNVQNALAAIAAARELGAPLERLPAALAATARVPGRFEPVEAGQDFAVLVDYAHTPDSLDNVLRAARELTGGRVHVVFGAGGDRDRSKRPLMGEVAARLADRVIVTSDNPRSEDPAAIVAEILAGIGPRVERELDRRAAIAQAVRGAEPGDVVVVAGKGHEQGQEFEGGRKEPFDDRAVAAEELRRALAERSTAGAAAPQAVEGRR